MKTYEILFFGMHCAKIKAENKKEALTKYMSSRGEFKREGYKVIKYKN